ncbi:MAG: EAL domain-containing protein [Nitrosomonas sp.]|nr:EAL domain-containing protein [Nitrosomonas sp.]
MNKKKLANLELKIESLEDEITRLELENSRLKYEIKIAERNEFKLREIQRIGACGIWELDQISDTFKCTQELANVLETHIKKVPTWNDFVLFTHPDDRMKLKEALQEAVVMKKTFEIEHRIEINPGKTKYIKHFCKPFYATNGLVTSTVGLIQDITKLKDVEANLTYQANYDMLTGLPNRFLFQDRLKHAIEQTQRSGKKIALMFLDLDNFKSVNDALGHLVGDELLVQVSHRIKQNIRESDTVARLGGDEFTIIIEQVDNEHQVISAAEHLKAVLNNHYQILSHKISITASIGITFYPEDGENINDLLKNADNAMYLAKKQGRNNYQLFTEDLNLKAQENLRITNFLRNALGNNELFLFYQPKIEISTGRVTGAEALLRWFHKDKEVTTPDRFIPIMEETGLIIPVGNWILDNACQFVKEWHDKGFANFKIAANVSVKQLQDKNLIEVVKGILKKWNLAPQHLELEITENTLIDTSNCQQNIESLRNLGIRIAIDDFGSGYSSLSYLHHDRANALKIDKSFISNYQKHGNDGAIIKSIIILSHTLQMEVVAEGVETLNQLKFLEELRCDQAQGFFISQPLSKLDLENWLKDCSIKIVFDGKYEHYFKLN